MGFRDNVLQVMQVLQVLETGKTIRQEDSETIKQISLITHHALRLTT